jgi:hypothetical protein
LHTIRREKLPADRIIPPGVVVIQPGHGIIELASVAFVRADGPGGVTDIPIGVGDLLALDGAAGQAEQDGSLSVGQVVGGDRAVRFAQQVPGDAVVIELTGLAAGAATPTGPNISTPYCSTFTFALAPPSGNGIPVNGDWW